MAERNTQGEVQTLPDVALQRPSLEEILTSREIEVLRLVAELWTNGAIAEKLPNLKTGDGVHITETTVAKHIATIGIKLGIREPNKEDQRYRLMGRAYELGLGTPEKAFARYMTAVPEEEEGAK